MISLVHRIRSSLRTASDLVRRFAIITLLLSMVQPSPLAGQDSPGGSRPDAGSERGRIVGQVTDRDSGTPLPGARVLLMDRALTAGVGGRFQMDDVPVGGWALEVRYLGYRPVILDDVEVRDGETTRLEVHLVRAAIELDAVSVSAQRQGGTTAFAMNTRRLASGVTNSISSEQIGRSPDGDAAAAIRRVSGVSVQDGKYVFVRGLGERYTTASLNGVRIPSPEPERKVVPLDLFPAGMLEAVSTEKTFTPDQPGDFSGAVVNIRTPHFPVRPVYSFSMSTGFRPGVTGSTIVAGPESGSEWLAMGTESRSLPRPAAEYSGAASRGDEVNGVVNSFRNTWSVREETGRLPASMGASMGGSSDLAGQTLGYLGSLSYSNSQEARLDERRARAGTGGSERDRYDGSSGTSSTSIGGLANLGLLLGNHSEIHLDNSYTRSADNEARREIGVDENTRSTVQVERLRYVERSVRSSQLRGEHQLNPDHGLDWSIAQSGVSRREPDRSEFVTWLDPDTPVWFNDFEGAVRTFGGLDESSVEVGVNYAFTLARSQGAPHRFRVGVLRRETDRTASSQGFRIQAFTWSPTDPRWQLPPEEFFDGRFAQTGDSDFLLSRELSGGNYTARDRQSAAYLMGEIEVGRKLQIVTGARLEHSDLLVDAENQLGQTDRVERDYVDLLPSLAANLRLAENHQLRLSATRTLARPEYREMAPITYREVLGGEQVIGNQDLERTLIDNVDARWDWYPSGDEILSMGVFAKRFHDPIEQRFLARSGTNTRTFENAEKAFNYGVEVEAMKGLGGLSETLDPLAIFMNATVMTSRVDTGVEGDLRRSMVGQAPYVVNGGLTWAAPAGGVSATLLYNVVGERIVNARASGTQVDDVVEKQRHLVDLSLRFPLIAGASGKLDLSNLLDAPYEVVQGSIVREHHRTGRSLSAGVSWQWR